MICDGYHLIGRASGFVGPRPWWVNCVSHDRIVCRPVYVPLYAIPQFLKSTLAFHEPLHFGSPKVL